jgi:hypothetical protein
MTGVIDTGMGRMAVTKIAVCVVQCARCPTVITLGSADQSRIAEEALAEGWIYDQGQGIALCPQCAQETTT